MITDRQIQETIARCVSTMVYYHNCERSRKADEQMVVEIQVIAGFVEEWGFEAAEIDQRLLRPVEGELIARYGHEVGPRMFVEFFEAFESIKEVVNEPRREPGGGVMDGRGRSHRES